MRKDVFLSHSSEDKLNVVIPFSKELEKLHISYWLDSIELTPGDSLVGKIFNGIKISKLVVVFISKTFLSKGWATNELRSALARQIRENEKIVVPFLIDIEFVDLISHFPEFENIFCGNLDNGLAYAAQQINKILAYSHEKSPAFLNSHEIINIQNNYNKDVIDKLSNLSYDELVNLSIKDGVDLLYSCVFGLYSQDILSKFISDRIHLFKENPLESFFQASLLNRLTPSISSKKLWIDIINRYPEPDYSIFESINLPSRENIELFKEIPAGEFLFGANTNDEYKKDWVADIQTVHLDSFLISVVPVTNMQYSNFFPSFVGLDHNKLMHPVTNVNWYESVMFANWLSYHFNKKISIPSEFQWEKAASWGDNGKFVFPWGNTWDPSRCATWDGLSPATSTERVGSYESGKSQYGIYDMSGNVWEWCKDWFSDEWGQYTNQNNNNPTGPLSGNRKVDRGGGWYEDVGHPTVHIRAADYPKDRFPHCGFRIIQEK